MNSYLIIFGLFGLIWLYAFFSTLTSEFKNNTNKIVWILLLIFLPVSAILYPFIGRSQVIEDTGITMSSIFAGIITLILFIVFGFLGYKFQHYLYDIFNINPNDYFNGYGHLVSSFFTGVIIVSFFSLFNSIMEMPFKKKIYIILGIMITATMLANAANNAIRQREEKTFLEQADYAWEHENYTTAFNIYSKYSDNKIIQNRLGLMYEKGLGIQQNYREAARWYQKSADQGYAKAQNNLALLYYKGLGLKNSYTKAFQLFQQAAEQNLYSAQNSLANMYHYGYGTKQNNLKAVQWYAKSANQGFDIAQTNLANMYYKGLGVEQNYKKAFSLYQQASSQNDPIAIFHLAEMYLKGVYVKKDPKKAFQLYLESVNLHYQASYLMLALLYYSGNGVKKDLQKAYKYLQKSPQNDPLVQYLLGMIYLNGELFPKNKKIAKEYLKKSANQGYQTAIKTLSTLK